MARIYPELVRPAHEYTRSKLPWRLDVTGPRKESRAAARYGWKLFHYLSGGGMKCFGKTIEQEEAEARQSRFLAVMGAAAAVWSLFYFF